jgi:hypothetical protein
MLEPQNRGALLEALRPPEGFVVDRALATTFTLDLTALLTAPLAFSFYDGLLGREETKAGADAVESLNPYALLKAVRGHAERLTVFCQATRIAAPPKYRRLLGYLEGSVVQVQARADEGVFHPKVWVLRFTREGDAGVRYRMLCLSRNLTFDRSWDTMLVLDGDYTGRTNAFRGNHPLGDFVAALPDLAITAMDAGRRATVLEIADELRRVKFELPENIETLRFHPLGIDGHGGWPFETRIERLLVVSPFVTEGALRKLSGRRRGDVLISRPEELEAIPAAVLEGFDGGLHVLSSAAELENDAPESSDHLVDAHSVASGLHAKVYVADDGWNAHIWTGSANATTAAFERNVEFLVQLTGKKRFFGVDAMLEGRDGKGGLRPLLATFTPPPEPKELPETERWLEKRLQALRTALGRGHWTAVAGPEENERFPFALELGGRLDLPEGVTVRCRPITLSGIYAQDLVTPLSARVADFGPISFEALTSFIAFTVKASEGEATLEDTFVLNVALEGAPENRGARILQALLDDPSKVLLFLQILLASHPMDALETIDTLDEMAAGGESEAAWRREAAPLFESLLTALDRDPGRIDELDRTVRDLECTEEGRRVLPEGLTELLEPIRAARAASRARGRS